MRHDAVAPTIARINANTANAPSIAVEKRWRASELLIRCVIVWTSSTVIVGSNSWFFLLSRRPPSRDRLMFSQHAIRRLDSDGTPRCGRRRHLVMSVRDYAIILLDCDGYVTSWNPGAERIKGHRAEEVIGNISESSMSQRPYSSIGLSAS